MKSIFKPLAALIGAVTLASVTPAAAATIITVDFEAGLPSNGLVFPGGNGHLETEPGRGKVLVIDPLVNAQYPYTDLSVLSLNTKYKDGNVVSRYQLLSFDIRADRVGALTVDALPGWVQNLQAGEWTNVVLPVGPDDMVRRLVTYGGFTIDNMVFEFDDHWAVVPEPGTWAMMIIGFGAAGSMVRASRRKSPAT